MLFYNNQAFLAGAVSADVQLYKDKLCQRHKASHRGFDSSFKDATAAQKQAADGKLVYEESVSAMSSIQRSSKNISTITRTIQDIAFQTNLLALNAGVEAARADNAGSGFSLVASEVRSLGQKAAEAAKEISELISTSSQQVNLVANRVEQAGNKLDVLSKAVNGLVRNVEGFRDHDAENASLASSIKEVLSVDVTDRSEELVSTSKSSSPVAADASLSLTGVRKSGEERRIQKTLCSASKTESITGTSAFGRTSHPDLAARSSSTLARPHSRKHDNIVYGSVEDDWSQF